MQYHKWLAVLVGVLILATFWVWLLAARTLAAGTQVNVQLSAQGLRASGHLPASLASATATPVCGTLPLWQPAASSTPKAFGGGTIASNGAVYSVGGEEDLSGSPSAQVQKYDPTSDTW